MLLGVVLLGLAHALLVLPAALSLLPDRPIVLPGSEAQAKRSLAEWSSARHPVEGGGGGAAEAGLSGHGMRSVAAAGVHGRIDAELPGVTPAFVELVGRSSSSSSSSRVQSLDLHLAQRRSAGARVDVLTWPPAPAPLASLAVAPTGVKLEGDSEPDV